MIDDDGPASEPDQGSAAMPGRRCGYRQCGSELEYDGQGRPPEYCRDRRWPGGRTCKQMAAAERAGERAAGLDIPLDTFRAVADRLIAGAGPLAEHLTAVLTAVAGVRDGALTRVGEAERLAEAAQQRAQAAEERVTEAERHSRRAVAESERAQQAAKAAEERARAVQRDADQRVTQATTARVEAEHARGRAEATAATASAALAEETRRRDQAERGRADVEERNRELRDRVSVLSHQLHLAEANAHHATQRVEHADAARVQAIKDLDRQHALAAELRAALDHARASAATERAEAAAATGAATASAQAAQARAAAAEARLDQFFAALQQQQGTVIQEDVTAAGEAEVAPA